MAARVEYVAYDNCDYHYEGTLDEILQSILENDQEVEDFTFVKRVPVKVKFVRKLVLEASNTEE